jgi:hypothetical protein
MSTIEEIENAIKNLSPNDLAEFRRWYVAFDSDTWDDEIRRDAESGKLDFLIEVHETREWLAAAFDYNIARIFADMRSREALVGEHLKDRRSSANIMIHPSDGSAVREWMGLLPPLVIVDVFHSKWQGGHCDGFRLLCIAAGNSSALFGWVGSERSVQLLIKENPLWQLKQWSDR